MTSEAKYKHMAHRVILAYSGDMDDTSPYLQTMYHTYQVDDTVPSDEVGSGPPSMYNDLDRKDRLQDVNDIRRQQGKRPSKDVFENPMLPVMVTVLNEEKTDEQNKRRNDTTDPGAKNDGDGDGNSDTIGFDPGTFTEPNEECSPDQFNNPYLA